MSNSPTISVQGLTKFYGKHLGVEDVSFDVEAGQIVGFLGPNGSGKTTVIRMLLGLLKISRGSARILGVDVSDRSGSFRKHVGYLPGTLALYENLTVGKFLEFIEHLRRVDCHGAIPELCERLQLSTSSPIKSLSKGNKQKVGVVQAFMHSPSVLILDEPTAGLDPIVQREFEILVREHRDRGAAVILSSHVLGEVEQLVSDVVILDRGHLVMHDNLHELKSRIERRLRFDFATTPPSDLFVGCEGISHIEVSDYSITCSVVGSEAPVLERAARANVETVRTYEPSLDDIFLSATAGSRNV